MEEQNIRIAIDRPLIGIGQRLLRVIKLPNMKSTTMTSCASIHNQAR